MEILRCAQDDGIFAAREILRCAQDDDDRCTQDGNVILSVAKNLGGVSF